MSHKKTLLRRELLQQRRSLTTVVWRQKSDRLCQQLESLDLFRQANTILAYFSFNQEPDLTPLFNHNKRWGFPRCVGKSLSWHSWQPGDILSKGVYGIKEPAPNSLTILPHEVDLILVPAIACDHQGYRLGYGGGFYDRMLNTSVWQNKPTVGIIFDFALIPQLPIDIWDQQLHFICTDAKNKPINH